VDVLKEQLKSIPDDPGIYQFLDESDRIIYIGKAKNLKKRVSSYFLKKDPRFDIKTIVLAAQIRNIKTIVTQSENEALVLENQLIKHHQPKYNIALKDDKTYPYIRITTEDPFPRILITRQKISRSNGSTYFGPYPTIGSSKYLLRLLYELFPLRDCTQSISLTTKQPKCINLDIGKCIGPCVIKDSKPTYDTHVNELKLLLSGKNKALIKTLKLDMETAANSLQFEKAAQLRDRLQKIAKLSERQHVDIPSDKTYHVIASYDNEDFYYLLVQHIIEGKLLYQNGFFLDKKDVETEDTFIAQGLLNFYENPSTIPDEIICTARVSSHLDGSFIPIICPQKGQKHTLLDTALRNAKLATIKLSRDQVMLSGASRQVTDTLKQLQSDLSLKQLPIRIIGFDISHLQGEGIVASAVMFENGLPKKSQYRHFKIRSVEGTSNDYESMYEVVLRKLSRLLLENDTMPHLLLIDGGKGQLAFAHQAIKELPLNEPPEIVSLAKRLEELYLPNQPVPIQLSKTNPGRLLLQRVRDEAHRFALRLQRKQRKTIFQETALDVIPGLGPKRVKSLYLKFKSIDKVKLATPEELSSIPGIGLDLATLIHKTLKP
jgi:excinuclease ABC subunit C